MIDLLDAGLITAGAILINPNDDVQAVVLPDGGIEFDGVRYDSPSGAGDAAHGGSTNGWVYWLADTSSGLRPSPDSEKNCGRSRMASPRARHDDGPDRPRSRNPTP